MKHIPLTRGYSVLVDDEDYERFIGYAWQAEISRRKDGSIRAVYATRTIGGPRPRKSEKLHRAILGVSDPRVEVDHRDHDGLNCQKYNLRVATRSQNQQNRRKILGKILPKGVFRQGRSLGYYAIIRSSGTRSTFGPFLDIEQASRKYEEQAALLHGEFCHVEGVRS